MTIAKTAADIELPMERPLFTPPAKPVIADTELQTGEGILDMTVLYSQVAIKKRESAGNIRRALQTRPQISLCGLLRKNPLEHGLAELVGYRRSQVNGLTLSLKKECRPLVYWKVSSGNSVASVLWRVPAVKRQSVNVDLQSTGLRIRT
jgi:hypothetical protein